MSTTQTTTVEAGTSRHDTFELHPVHASESRAAWPDAGPEMEGPAAGQQKPRSPLLKIIGAGFSFFCAGVNDGTLGPLIPYMLATFSIGTGEVAVM